MEIKEIKQWFELAVPEPTPKTRAIQVGVHFEEVGEMAFSLGCTELSEKLDTYSDMYKSGNMGMLGIDKVELLDSLCDQIVTAIGVAHMFGYDIEGALKEVNRSNFSKFVDGKPIFNEQGKISKPSSYSPPNLLPYLGDQK